MRIRALHPHIESLAVKKKQKALSRYKENIRRRPKYHVPPLLYSEMSTEQRESNKLNGIKHSIEATKGLTPKMRTIRRRRRKEYLRLKYKLQNRTKVCTICKENKALSDFDFQKDSTHHTRYRRTYCYVCRKDMNAKAYQRRKNEDLL